MNGKRKSKREREKGIVGQSGLAVIMERRRELRRAFGRKCITAELQ